MSETTHTSSVLVIGSGAASRSKEMGSERDLRALEEAREETKEALARRGDLFARPLQREVRDIMWQHCGVVRTKEELEEGIQKLQDIEGVLGNVESRPDIAGFDDLAHAFDLHAMLKSSQATALSALRREESRGAHQRSDFPETGKPENILFHPDGSVSTKPVPLARDAVRKRAAERDVQSEQLLE